MIIIGVECNFVSSAVERVHPSHDNRSLEIFSASCPSVHVWIAADQLNARRLLRHYHIDTSTNGEAATVHAELFRCLCFDVRI